MTGNAFYVIDSSSLINLRQYYPLSVFKSLWKKCEELIHQDRLGAPTIVLTELERKDDELKKWAQKHQNHLFHENPDHYLKAREILQTFPKLINSALEHEQADPFVIAMALDRIEGPQKSLFSSNQVYLVTEEKFTGKRKKKTTIPEVCNYYEVPCIPILEMIIKEGWEF
ncbi:MAG: DUF4411 family protein [Clostridia bacterium]|nr:DUF4411 family protein [Clostridia bacterium]